MSIHSSYMKRALSLARKGEGLVSPNPMVGAVIVRDGVIIGEGWHKAFGEAHGEVEAIRSAQGDCAGATLYVTLEPCCHYGKTPPCTEAIIEAGIVEVYYAAPDPNPMVAGKGHRQLELEGIRVNRGPHEEEARDLNRAFFHFITTGKPYIIAKYAMSLDGKIATATGESQWITGIESRLEVHRLRNIMDAILVGADTLIADNPQLTTRIPGENCRHPCRIILDSHGRVPLNANVFDPSIPGETIVASTSAMPETHRALLEARGVTVLTQPEDENGSVSLDALLDELGKKGIATLMVEGGAKVLGSFLTGHHIQETWTFVGGKLIGGEKAPSPFGGEGIPQLAQALNAQIAETVILGSDVLIKTRIRRGV